MADATPAAGFACADLTLFCRLDELGLEVTGQRLEPGRAVLRAGSSSRIDGAGSAAVRGLCVTP